MSGECEVCGEHTLECRCIEEAEAIQKGASEVLKFLQASEIPLPHAMGALMQAYVSIANYLDLETRKGVQKSTIEMLENLINTEDEKDL